MCAFRGRLAPNRSRRHVAALALVAVAVATCKSTAAGAATAGRNAASGNTAGRALRPLRTITAAAQRISASSLNERLALDGPDDEIKELGDTFDGLLARLEASFRSQRQFVANASHELRTPLGRQRLVTQPALNDPAPTIQSLPRAHERGLAAGAEPEHPTQRLRPTTT